MQSHQILPKHKRDTSFEKKKTRSHNNNRVFGTKGPVCTNGEETERRLPRWRNWRWGNAPIFSPSSFLSYSRKKTKSQTHRHTRKHGDIQVCFFFACFRCLLLHTHAHSHIHTQELQSHTVKSCCYCCLVAVLRTTLKGENERQNGRVCVRLL